MMSPALSHDIATTLRHNEASLRQMGVKSLALFGSTAKQQHGPESDLDLLYEFAEGAATLDHLLALQSFLESLFGKKVDLVSRKYMHPALRRSIKGAVIPVYKATS